MAKKILIVALFGLFSLSCSKFKQFDRLYQEKRYLEAYLELTSLQIKPKQLEAYQKRLLQVVIQLGLQGDPDFLTNKLPFLLNKQFPASLNNYIQFGKVFLEFYSAQDEDTYSDVISNLTINIAGNEILSTNVPDEFMNEAYKMRGIAYYKTGEFQKSISDMQTSYSYLPQIENYFYIGLDYMGLNETEQALRYFDKVIERSRDPLMISQSYFYKGEVYYDEKRYQTALENYIQAVNHYCKSANYNFKIAKCLQKLGYNEIYSHFLKICLRIDENFATAYYYLNIY